MTGKEALREMTLHKLNEPDPEPDPDQEFCFQGPTLDQELEWATWRYECDGCGAIVAGTEPLHEWLELSFCPVTSFSSGGQPSGIDPFERLFTEAHHVCSIACIVTLAVRLAEHHK